jgi:hypothetical protein
MPFKRSLLGMLWANATAAAGLGLLSSARGAVIATLADVVAAAPGHHQHGGAPCATDWDCE